MWFFLSPCLYSIDTIPAKYQPIFRINPFSELMTSYRDIIMRGQMPSWYDLGYAFAAGLFCCLVGYMLFRRYEGRFVHRL
jgi:ABC-type polysaccharide/polyol phosphate export permease